MQDYSGEEWLKNYLTMDSIMKGFSPKIKGMARFPDVSSSILKNESQDQNNLRLHLDNAELLKSIQYYNQYVWEQISREPMESQPRPLSIYASPVDDGSNNRLANRLVKNLEQYKETRLPLPRRSEFNTIDQALPTKSLQQQRPHLRTELSELMQHLSMASKSSDQSQRQDLPEKRFQRVAQLESTGCVFCKNNNYHSTFYKSHFLKDEFGRCQCPVLRAYVCPLCKATGDNAHTIKYCPANAVTKGDPISAGLPPGKVSNWREMVNQLVSRRA